MTPPITVGVLAYQGAVEPHLHMLARCGVRAVAVRTRDELEQVDGLILPGGESTTLNRLLRRFGLDRHIAERIAAGMPVFGTCAGLILLAKNVIGGQPSALACMDVTVARNAFGRQTESFVTQVDVAGLGEPFEAVFIRAPYIQEVGPGVEVLGYVDDRIVAARQGRLWGAAFHPELTDDPRFHERFVACVAETVLAGRTNG